MLLERYVSREALAEHRSVPHFTQVLLGQIVPLMESRTVEEYDIPGQPGDAPSPHPTAQRGVRIMSSVTCTWAPQLRSALIGESGL